MTWKNTESAGKALRTALICGSSMAVFGLAATPAFAEDGPIVVTGSRLVVPSGLETATPVTSLDAEEIENMDPGTLIQAMNTMPIFINNDTPNSNQGFFARSSTSTLNLRGLGVNRTLTLLDGRRIAPTSAFGGVDISLIPESMLRGVENVTGGASAAYGTDAVAGVTNFLLDTNFTGLEVNLQGGINGYGDGKSYEASISFGTEIGSRGHFLMSLEVGDQDGIFSLKDRPWYHDYGLLDSDGDGVSEVWPDIHSSRASFDGIIFGATNAAGQLVPFSFNTYAFDSSGGYAPFQYGDATSGAVGGLNSRTSGGSGDDIGCGEVCNVWPDTDRYSVFAYGEYEIADNVTLFAQYMRGYSHLWENANPRGSFTFPTALRVYQDNFYLPDEINNAMKAQGVDSFQLGRMCSIEDCGALYYEERTTQNIGTLGFKAEIAGDGFLGGWHIDGYYQYGHSKKLWDQFGLRVDRVSAAFDAVDNGSGVPVCRVTLFGNTNFPGCQPLNLFGRGNASPAAVDYVTGNDVGVTISTPIYWADTGFALGDSMTYTTEVPGKRNITTFEQHFAELTFAGNVFDMPAGPVSLALGGSYRRDSIVQLVQDQGNQSSNHDTGRPVPCNGSSPGLRVSGSDCTNSVAFQFSKVSNIQGAADVKEVFGETLIPLFNTGKGQSANLNLAGRWADYQGSGTIWSYKGSLDINVIEGIRLRGTYSRDVRAPNLNERFNKTGGLGTVTDPRITQADIDACRLANPTNIAFCTATYSITTFSGGNPNVAPEKADTYTAGIVFQPTFFPGFAATLDWYTTQVNGAIDQVGATEVARRCYVDMDPQFCDLVTESTTLKTDFGGYNRLTVVGNQYVNVAKKNVSGIDVELRYNTDISLLGGGAERLGLRGFASWLLERSDTGAPLPTNNFDPTPVQFVGFNSFPRFRATGYISYNNGPFNAVFTGRVIGHALIQNPATATGGITIEDNDIPAVFYLDSRLNYDFNVGNSKMQVFFTVTNLLDKDPPIYATWSFFTAASTQTFPALHDVLGRRFTLGVKFTL